MTFFTNNTDKELLNRNTTLDYELYEFGSKFTMNKFHEVRFSFVVMLCRNRVKITWYVY